MKANDKPALVVLHGWGLSASRFSPLSRVLKKKGYRVFIPDLPGFGASGIPTRPYTLSDYASFLANFIRQKKLRNVVCIGHSFGGRVSLKYAMSGPVELSSIILTGTPGYTPVPKKKLLLFILFAKIGKFFFSMWPLTLIQEKIRLWYYYVVGAREFYRAQGVMRETFKLIVQEDLSPAMRQIRVPCLLVWGELDQITPVWIAEKMNTIIKNSELIIIPDRDHGVPFKDPNTFVTHIEDFLHTL